MKKQKAKKITKKRNPNDGTLRNVRAANEKFADLTKRIRNLELKMKHIYNVCFSQ